MMRLACFFALIALVPLVLLILRLNGATATLFSFVGIPALCVALGLYALARWRRSLLRTPGQPLRM